jgi:hypothetical protein
VHVPIPQRRLRLKILGSERRLLKGAER